MKYQSIRIMKKTSTIDLKDSPHGDNRFYRYEYWGIDSMFILHYVTFLRGFNTETANTKRDLLLDQHHV